LRRKWYGGVKAGIYITIKVCTQNKVEKENNKYSHIGFCKRPWTTLSCRGGRMFNISQLLQKITDYNSIIQLLNSEWKLN